MTEFEGILKSANWFKDIQKNMGTSSILTEMLKTHNSIANSYSGISMMSEIAKRMQHPRLYMSPTMSALEAMTKSINYGIPQTTINAITSISTQQNQLFGNLRNLIATSTVQYPAFSQINSWQSALSGISGQLAAAAAISNKWDLIDDFEAITEEAISLEKRIFDENGVTNERLSELKEFFERIEIKVDKIDGDKSVFWKLLAILSFILTLVGEARNWLPKPEYATKKEVETVINQQFTLYEKKLKENKEFRITNQSCKVMSKPALKSSVIDKLPSNSEVTVLQINHKWVYVSYSDTKDNLPQTGWIMKKYLEKP